MTRMESCDPALTQRKSHPLNYFTIFEALNGDVYARIGFINLKSSI